MAKEPFVGWSLSELASIMHGTCDGPPDLRILGAATADSPEPHRLSFAETDAYMRRAAQGGVGAVLAKPGVDTLGIPSIRVEHPRAAFGMFLAMCERPLPLEPGIHPTAVVSPEAEVADGVRIGPYAVVEAGAKIGVNVRIFPFVYVGENCVIGSGAVIYPHAVLYRDVTIGDRTVIHAGVVLAADGFGFVWDGNKQLKVSQVGKVEIGDDCEIGANSTIDRATAGTTTIRRGVKLDNLVMIAHNCDIGEHSVLAAFCGISGSTRIGKRCTLAGQVGTSDHVTVGDDITLGGRTGVTKDILKPGAYWGTPAKPYVDALKSVAMQQKLPDMFDRIRALEKRLEELEAK